MRSKGPYAGRDHSGYPALLDGHALANWRYRGEGPTGRGNMLPVAKSVDRRGHHHSTCAQNQFGCRSATALARVLRGSASNSKDNEASAKEIFDAIYTRCGGVDDRLRPRPSVRYPPGASKWWRHARCMRQVARLGRGRDPIGGPCQRRQARFGEDGKHVSYAISQPLDVLRRGQVGRVDCRRVVGVRVSQADVAAAVWLDQDVPAGEDHAITQRRARVSAWLHRR